jgi:hypothetical protein
VHQELVLKQVIYLDFMHVVQVTLTCMSSWGKGWPMHPMHQMVW